MNVIIKYKILYKLFKNTITFHCIQNIWVYAILYLTSPIFIFYFGKIDKYDIITKILKNLTLY